MCRKTPRRLVTPQFVSPAILFAALLAAGSASAENWEIAPRVEAGYRYSDNYHLGPPGTELEVSGAEADALVTFRTLDPRTQVEITPRVRGTYFDVSDENSIDGYLDASFADVGKGLEGSRSVVEEFARVARQQIAQGAGAIIPGQLYLSEAIARAGIPASMRCRSSTASPRR